MNNNPIGIFDSGVGGLTVLREITNLLPNEDLIYLGDTARVPYGTRGKEIINEFSLQSTRFLLNKKIKFLVVACNTISATCLSKIRENSSVSVLGVIQPAAQKISNVTKSKKVGVIGTPATIRSKVYEREIHAIDRDIHIQSIACPLFVPIVEEGLSDSEIAKNTVHFYLSELKNIDTLHLGCTHYPLLKNTIQNEIGDNITIIDSALPTALKLKDELIKCNLLSNDAKGVCTLFFTDITDRTHSITELFLGKNKDLNMQKAEVNEFR